MSATCETRCRAANFLVTHRAIVEMSDIDKSGLDDSDVSLDQALAAAFGSDAHVTRAQWYDGLVTLPGCDKKLMRKISALE